MAAPTIKSEMSHPVTTPSAVEVVKSHRKVRPIIPTFPQPPVDADMLFTAPSSTTEVASLITPSPKTREKRVGCFSGCNTCMREQSMKKTVKRFLRV